MRFHGVAIACLAFLFLPLAIDSRTLHNCLAQCTSSSTDNEAAIATALLALPALQPPYKLALCTIIHDEGPYILEWVLYHWLVGFQHFWLYDNDSTDDTRTVLAPLVARGLVTVIRWPRKEDHYPTQLAQMDNCFNHSGPAAQTRWLACFDVDEFVVVHNHDPRNLPLLNRSLEFALHRHLAAIEGVGAGQLRLDRIDFGADGHLTRPAGLVIATHTEKDLDMSRHAHTFKSIVLTKALVARKNPHFVDFYELPVKWRSTPTTPPYTPTAA